MDLKVNYSKVKSADEAYNAVKAFITSEYLSKYQVKVDMSYDNAKKLVKAQGKGFEFSLHCKDSCCEVSLDLSLLLRPMKSTILSKIEHQISKNL